MTFLSCWLNRMMLSLAFKYLIFPTKHQGTWVVPSSFCLKRGSSCDFYRFMGPQRNRSGQVGQTICRKKSIFPKCCHFLATLV